MKDLPEDRVPLEGGWGSSLLGISLTTLSLMVMVLLNLYPQTGAESFILSLITAACLMGTGATILTLVSDYPLILTTISIFLLLLYWRLRHLDPLWLLALSIAAFLLAIYLHIRSPERRRKGRARISRVDGPPEG